ncbi:MAG: hypothetical protein WCC01_15300 [Acidimicrobiia bacterium]
MTDNTPPVEPAANKRWYQKWWVWVIAAVVIFVAIGVATGDPEAGEDTAAESTVTSADSTTTTVEDTETTTTEGTTTTTAAAETTTTAAAETTTTAPTTTTTTVPPTTTTTVPVYFSDGTWLIGTDIAAGVYQTAEPSGTFGCYWERLSGLSGGFDDIIANDNPDGLAIVEIMNSDEAFSSERCGDWIDPQTHDPALTSFGDGDWMVGTQIVPGRYRNTGGDSCYWERVSGWSGGFGDILANDNVDGSTIVDISFSDVGFSAARCGTWELAE